MLSKNSTLIHQQLTLSLSPLSVGTRIQEGKDKGKRKDGAGKCLKEQLERESASLTDTYPESVSQQPPDDKNVEIYTRLLHRKARPALSLLTVFNFHSSFEYLFKFFRDPMCILWTDESVCLSFRFMLLWRTCWTTCVTWWMSSVRESNRTLELQAQEHNEYNHNKTWHSLCFQVLFWCKNK